MKRFLILSIFCSLTGFMFAHEDHDPATEETASTDTQSPCGCGAKHQVLSDMTHDENENEKVEEQS